MRPNVVIYTFEAQHTTELTRLQRDKQSTPATRQSEVVTGNRQSALETARKGTPGALTRNGEAAEGKQRLSPGISDFKQWMRGSSVNADSLISDYDRSSSSDIHQVLAHNALLKVRSQNWSSAYEDANKVILSCHPCTYVRSSHVKSIVIRPSAMGHIAKALAQIGMDEPEKATQVFDLAFGNCNPNESNLLLLIKVCDLFT